MEKMMYFFTPLPSSSPCFFSKENAWLYEAKKNTKKTKEIYKKKKFKIILHACINATHNVLSFSIYTHTYTSHSSTHKRIVHDSINGEKK